MREDAIPVERHPLEPFVPGDARVLFLGSFPPPRRRWCMPFFYPNYINDHWRIQGLVFYGDAGYFVEVCIAPASQGASFINKIPAALAGCSSAYL